jgi:hypothetical protein
VAARGIGRHGLETAMKLWVVILLVVIALAIGGGVGVVGGFMMTVIDRIGTDQEVACALLQKAETGHYISKAQRAALVDKVMPAREVEIRAGERNAAADWMIGWGDRIRDYMKSGCPGV